MDRDGYISNGELFQVLKMMVGSNLKDTQLQQIVDKTILYADKDNDGKISFVSRSCQTLPFMCNFLISFEFRKRTSSRWPSTSRCKPTSSQR